MNEIQRLAYLEAMDIPSFVSRRDLPGAAPSRRFALVRKPAAVSTPTTPAPLEEARPPAPDLGLPELAGGRPSVAAPEVRPEPVPSRAAVDTPVFTVAVCEAGGWLWIDEIPAGRDPGDAYVQLIGAICQALGLPADGLNLQYFNYPVAAGAALAGGMDEARQALFGFLSGRIGRLQPTRVVLLGDMEQAWFDAECLGNVAQTRTVSAWGMLRDPSLKAQAWRDLKPLKVDAG